jgi:hypothetical protein
MAEQVAGEPAPAAAEAAAAPAPPHASHVPSEAQANVPVEVQAQGVDQGGRGHPSRTTAAHQVSETYQIPPSYGDVDQAMEDVTCEGWPAGDASGSSPQEVPPQPPPLPFPSPVQPTPPQYTQLGQQIQGGGAADAAGGQVWHTAAHGAHTGKSAGAGSMSRGGAATPTSLAASGAGARQSPAPKRNLPQVGQGGVSVKLN